MTLITEHALPRLTLKEMSKHRMLLSAVLGDGPRVADTFGWDTVFAIALNDVNRAIVHCGSSPGAFSRSASGSGMNVTVEGMFDDWQVVPGGDGQNLHMALPITTLKYDTGDEVKQFDQLLALIEVRLTLLPQPDSSSDGSDGGQWMDLKLRTGGNQLLLGAAPAGNQPVYVLDLECKGDVKPEGLESAIIQQLLLEWLRQPENLQSFNHVFASVDLGAKAAVGAFQWLMPTHLSYAVIDRGTLESSTFALLCMTEQRDADGLAHQVSPFVIPDGHRAGMLLSRERFLSKLLLPGIGTMFSGPVKEQKGKKWPNDYFEVDEKDATIVNLADIKIDNFQVEENGDKYTADLAKGNLRVRLQNTYLETQMIDLHHRLNHFMSWLHVYHNINTRATAKLTEQVFDLAPGGGEHHAVVNKDKTAEWIEIGVLAATLVAMTGWAAARGVGTMASRVESTTATAATVAAEATVDVVPTVEQSAAISAEGAATALTGLRGGVVQASRFLEAWQVANRASVIMRVGAVLVGLEELLSKLSDVTMQKSMPKFQEFAAGMMAPVKWPAQESEFTVESIAFNGSFQIAGNPGFAD
jgi:hypothetical protein